jgi:hypothetical protein
MEITQFLAKNNLQREPWVDQLAGFNVNQVEQLTSLVASPTGELALQEFRLDTAKLRPLLEAYLQQTYQSSLTGDARFSNRGFAPLGKMRPLGYIRHPGLDPRDFGYRTRLHPQVAAGGSNPGAGPEPDPVATDGLPAEHFLYPASELPQARNQGKRGTCVAFAAVALLEHALWSLNPSGTTPQLSAQYLYYRAKQRDPNQAEDGTFFEHAMESLHGFGVCPESELQYREYVDWRHELLFSRQVDINRLDQAARLYRVATYRFLPVRLSVTTIKRELHAGRAVGAGVLVFGDAWFGGYTNLFGEVAMPLTRPATGEFLDPLRGGHAITLMGYRDTPPGGHEAVRPGGGYFTFRNSWGTDWAAGNNTRCVDQRGYGNLPYEYLALYGEEACVIDNLSEVVPDGPGAARAATARKQKKVPAPAKKQTGAKLKQ